MIVAYRIVKGQAVDLKKVSDGYKKKEGETLFVSEREIPLDELSQCLSTEEVRFSSKLSEFKSNIRDPLLKEADRWELPSYQKRYGLEQEEVENYKTVLLELESTFETISDIENVELPLKPENVR